MPMAAEPTIALQALPAEVQRAIAQVRAREASARDAAMFDLPARAGPFRLRQMLPHDALLLFATQNAMFRGAPAAFCPLADLYLFVARLCPWPRLVVGVLLAATLALGGPRRRLYAALDAYQAETFIDWPAASGVAPRGDALKGSFLSHLFHMVAAAYHWPESAIAAIPVRRLLIYRKHIEADALAAAGRSYVDISAAERRIKAEWMEAVNARGGCN